MKRPIAEYFRFIWAKPVALLIKLPIPAIFRKRLYQIRGVRIGNGSKIGDGVYMDEKYPSNIHIGNNVWIAAKCIILAHKRNIDKYFYGDNIMSIPHEIGEVFIEDGVLLGAGSIVLPGVRIGKGAIIGAGSVITKDVESYTVVAGNPARVLKVIERK